MPFSVGDKVGHYEILSLLGEGGMGEVYRARDTTLRRDVALKVLPAAVLRDHERTARFQREAEVLASLDHPNIGHIHGIVDSENLRGLVLALIDGPTLAEHIASGPLPVDQAITIAKQIIEALEYAHDRGVVHRDLKPANIKITPDGVVKVLDFGLAKVLEDEPKSSSSLANSPTLTMGHTRAGVILGTAAYMSPEQAVGRTVDRRSDIFSFGAVLYEMLTGQHAFPGATTPDVLENVVKNDPDWSALPAGTPLYLRKLLERTLVKDRKHRLQAIGEARIALQQASSDEPVTLTPASTKKSGILWPAIAAVSLLIAAGVLAWTYLRPAPIPEVTQFEIHAPSGTTLPLGTPAVSPDGRTIAFVAADKQQIRRIYVRTLDSVEARVLPGTDGAVHPFFSPDGRSLAFASQPRLMRIDLAGGAPRVLADLNGPWHGSWNQNGTILFAASGGIDQVSANGGPATPVLEAVHPYFLPDGKRFLARDNTASKIELATLGSQERKPVLDNADSAAFIAPTPGGPTYMFYMRSSNVLAHQFDEAEGKLVGEPTAILDNVGRVAIPAVTPTLGVSRSGTLAYQKSTSGGLGHLTWYDRTGKAINELPSQAAGRDPALSPDGQFAAVTRMDGSTQTEDVWVVDLKRGTSSRLTFEKERDTGPFWSLDGKRVTFHRAGVGVMEKDASGAGNEIVLTPGGAAQDRSPDGKYLVQIQGAGKAALVPVTGNAAGGQKPVPIGSSRQSRDFQFSPDGQYIAYRSDESGRAEVYVQPMPPGTGRWQVSVNGGGFPRWRRDGKELFFTDGSNLLAVEVSAGASFSAGTPHALLRAGQGRYAVSADGQRFLIYSDEGVESDSPIIVVQNWWAALRK